MGKLTEKTILITGAASGMGKSMALLFAAEGANVSLFDSNKNGLEEIKKNIVSGGQKAKIFNGDVSNERDCNLFINESLKEFKKIDALVNNAGIMDDFLPIDKLENEFWNKVMSVNLQGPFYLSRLVIPHFRKYRKGNIINIASVGGTNGSRAGVAYTASKHGLIGLTKNVAFMYAQEGIRCNAIAPGGVKTNIGINMRPDEFGYSRCTSGGVNMPRMGEPDEIARIALFLVCEDSSFINGAVLTADGGWTAY